MFFFLLSSDIFKFPDWMELKHNATVLNYLENLLFQVEKIYLFGKTSHIKIKSLYEN